MEYHKERRGMMIGCIVRQGGSPYTAEGTVGEVDRHAQCVRCR